MTQYNARTPNNVEGLSAKDTATNKQGYLYQSDGALHTDMPVGVLVQEEFDAIQADYPTATSEVYEYYLGGLAGTLVATVTIVYTTSDKDFIDTVVRT